MGTDRGGFERVNMAVGRSDKVGWEARNQSSVLALCPRFPRRAPSAAPKTEGREPPYVIGVGLTISHALNLPLFGTVTLSCHGGCHCSCVYSHHGAFNSSCRISRSPRKAQTTPKSFKNAPDILGWAEEHYDQPGLKAYITRVA